MECKVYDFNSFKNYKYADIFAIYKGQWIFCKHKERNTWEAPGGHIEDGETPLVAAKRELLEETGATTFDIQPLCDYWVCGSFNGETIDGYGQVYFANVYELGDIPESEMEQVCLTDTLPMALTYPEYTLAIFPLAQKKLNTN